VLENDEFEAPLSIALITLSPLSHG
jgi:hypothetical protein